MERTAAAIAVPSATAGTIETRGDTDWFKFQATAGKTYVFTVGLGTLRDSVLSLYGLNGATRLASNDDYGPTAASQITWKAPASGTYYVVVGAYGNSLTGSYTLCNAVSGFGENKSCSNWSTELSCNPHRAQSTIYI